MAADDQQDLNPYIQMRPERQAPRLPMPEMDAVDWASLEDAYGPATAVPELIRGLTSADPADRAWALDGLDACIHHQGSVYSGSTAAVPFLITLAADPRVDDRELILSLLAGIAVHEPDACLVNGAFQYRSEAYDAVRQGAQTFLNLLVDPSPPVQTAAAFVLCFLEPPADGALEALSRGLGEIPHPHSRASRAMALGYVSRYLESSEARDALGALLEDPEAIVRLGAGVGLAEMEGIKIGADAKRALEACYRCAPLEPEAGFWPWLMGDLARHARIIRESVITDEELLARMDDPALPDDEREHAARKCVYRMLRADRDRLHDLVLPADLSETQLRLLGWLADNSDQKNYDYEFFERQGLPDSHAQLLRFIGREKGALDQPLSASGRQMPAWYAIRETCAGRLEPARLAEAVAALDQQATAALVEDALTGPWMLYKPRGGTPYGEPDAMQAFKRYTDRFLGLMADLAGVAGEAGLAWARQTAEAQIVLGKKRRATSSLVAAIVLGRDAQARGESLPEAWDGLVALDQVPASTHQGALLTAYQFIPPQRRERLLAERPLYSYRTHTDPDGVSYRWTNRDGWQFLVLLSGEQAAQRVIEAWMEWDRHQRGVGNYTEFASGGVSSTLKQRPEPDDPFPEEMGLAALEAGGGQAIPALEAALKDPDLENTGLIDQALAKARAASLH